MNSSELRSKARESLTGKYWPAVAVAFVAAIFGAHISGAASFSLNIDEEALRFLFEDVPAIVVIALALVGGVFATLNLVHFVLGGVIQLGYAKYLLKQHDAQECTVKDLFSQFDHFTKGFLQAFLRGLYTFLWALLFVIPGIIKSLSYAMTPYIMAEHPEMTAKEAITASKEAMDGHKWELFCLEFSFIGWQLLVALTMGIGSIFLAPYVEAAYAAFYRDKIAPKTAVYAESYIPPQIDVTM